MASSAEAGAGAAALTRSQARAILAESRFHVAPVPRPLHGLLHAVGRALEAPLTAVEEAVSSVGSVTPGGPAVVWATLAAVVLVLAGALALRGTRRTLHDAPAQLSRARALHASDLERDAEAAEREGRNGDAVRLRFRAGLMRLAEIGRLEGAPSMLNAEVSRSLHSERFDALARRFEEIAYGGQEAAERDTQASRRGWSELLSSRRDG